MPETDRYRVLIDTPAWFIRPNNTDWRYMRGLARLSDHIPIEISAMRSTRDALEDSCTHVARRFGVRPTLGRRVLGGDLKRTRAQVVLSHRRFPQFAARTPVVWMYAVVDPAMQMANGQDADEIEGQYLSQRPFYEASALVQMPTRADVVRHTGRFPELADRFVYCPFFLPDLSSISDEALAAKECEDGPLRLLFVGREARRKGLPALLEAVASLPRHARRALEVDVVTTFSDGAVDIPVNAKIRTLAGAPHREVMEMMQAAHVFAMPSRFESYGLVFVEAMAKGCVVIAPDFEAQREILGGTGVNVGCVETLREALLGLIEAPERRRTLARQALARARSEYLPSQVAGRYGEIIARAVRNGGR